MVSNSLLAAVESIVAQEVALHVHDVVASCLFVLVRFLEVGKNYWKQRDLDEEFPDFSFFTPKRPNICLALCFWKRWGGRNGSSGCGSGRLWDGINSRLRSECCACFLADCFGRRLKR